MDRWVGRVAIVTGASAGIGAVVCRQLVEHGLRVVGVARRVERVKELAKEIKNGKGELHAFEGDVSKEEDIKKVVKFARDTLGGADILINNAGVIRNSPLISGETEDWRAMLDVNILGLCMFTREVIKDMRDRGLDDGHVMHINSVMGHHILSFPGTYVYSVTKHAVTVLTEGLRRELRDLGSHIRITSVSPGLTKTDIMTASGAPPAAVESLFRENKSLNPEDVASAVLYALAAPASVNIEEITLRVTCASD